MDRRQFIKSSTTVGAGLVIGFYLPGNNVLAQFGAPPLPTHFPPNGFVKVSPDNVITVISKHTEMGQGIYTGLATLLADEMDADWSQIKVESAPVDPNMYRHFTLGMQGTGGSSSIPNSWLQYRTVGATARAMLVSAAASEWGVAESEITVLKGVLSHSSGKKASFGDMSVQAAALSAPDNVPLKTPEQYIYIGKGVSKVDSKEKVNGTAKFTIDVKRPGMLTAVVAHSPRFGGKLVSFDDEATRKIKGVVEVVEIPRGVAVLAENTFAAIKGRDALETAWDFSTAENRSSDDIIADYKKLLATPGAPVQIEGDSAKAIAEGEQTFEATYEFPYLAHATMEPLDCSMEMIGDRCVIRSGTQMQSVERDRVAEVLDMDPANVEIETLFAGGGFGRRGNFVPDIAQETATILKAIDGRYPIKLQYTREDDTTAGFYRPLFVHRLKGAVDSAGNITAWENRLVGQSFIEGTFMSFLLQNGLDPLAIEGAAELPYEVENVNVDFHMAKAGVPALAWRSVGHTHTAFSKETFLDEMLHATGKDPVSARLALMHDESAKAVLSLAAEKSNWGKSPQHERGIGVAYVESFGTKVAEVVEISLSDSGKVIVEKVVCTVNCGTAINPEVIRAQVESAIMFGMSAALYGEVKIENGEVQTKNFDTYPVVRMNQAPDIEVHIVPSNATPTGIGEPAVPPIGPAIANAYFNLTGKRVRQLPFEPVFG